MREWLNENPMTALLYVVFLIVAVIGGIITVVNPSALSFEDYTIRLVIFGGAVGVFGGGRAIKNGLLGKTSEDGLPPADEDFSDIENGHDEDEPVEPVPGPAELAEQFPGEPPSDDAIYNTLAAGRPADDPQVIPEDVGDAAKAKAKPRPKRRPA